MVNSYPLYLDELEELLVFRCQQLMKHHDLIQGLTCFHWWPRAKVKRRQRKLDWKELEKDVKQNQ